MTAATRIPAAAPAWVRSLVDGPERAARVVHRGSDAVYLEVDGWCLGVLSNRATAVPCAARTGLVELPAALQTADRAVVGGGEVALHGTSVVLARTVDARVPSLSADRLAVAAQRLAESIGERLDPVRAELGAEALQALADGRAEAVRLLLGRGSGLTPVGDDVLAGWMATGVAAGAIAAGHAELASAVAQNAGASTTLLSATLLDCARRGDVIPQFRALLLALGDGTGVDDAVGALLGVGHTSGAGMALGTLLALRHLAPRRPA